MSSPEIEGALADLKRAILVRRLTAEGIKATDRTLRAALAAISDPVRFRAFLLEARRTQAGDAFGGAGGDDPGRSETADLGDRAKHTGFAGDEQSAARLAVWLSYPHRAINKGLDALVRWFKRT